MNSGFVNISNIYIYDKLLIMPDQVANKNWKRKKSIQIGIAKATITDLIKNRRPVDNIFLSTPWHVYIFEKRRTIQIVHWFDWKAENGVINEEDVISFSNYPWCTWHYNFFWRILISLIIHTSTWPYIMLLVTWKKLSPCKTTLFNTYTLEKNIQDQGQYLLYKLRYIVCFGLVEIDI